ncbi:hypothetical protein EIP91_004219 [Steccherinum ochraceum]|uniref:Uncharacterized protein n=1 Tax=Steccherinum ochraceum TaxID=92696 RepID=A0A4R0R974_9APHY|nr:hypothetical protein EIP91_004219 [Steccherinum ochraceum]
MPSLSPPVLQGPRFIIIRALISAISFLVNTFVLNAFCSVFLLFQAATPFPLTPTQENRGILPDLVGDIVEACDGPRNLGQISPDYTRYVDYSYLNVVLLSTNIIFEQTNLDCLFQANFFFHRGETNADDLFTLNKRCVDYAASSGPFTTLTLVKMILFFLLTLLAQIPVAWLFHFYVVHVWRIKKDVALKGRFGVVYGLASAPLQVVPPLLRRPTPEDSVAKGVDEPILV